MKNKSLYAPAFTLVETLLYMSIFSLIIGALFSLYWMAVIGWTKSHALLSVHEAATLLSTRITQDVARAKSVLEVSPERLCLESSAASHNPTLYYITGGRMYVAWGGGDTNCVNFTHDQLLSSSEVSVAANFTGFPDIQPTKIVNLSLQIDQINTGNRSEFSAATSVSTSARLRSQQP